jgi:hypothetical protein
LFIVVSKPMGTTPYKAFSRRDAAVSFGCALVEEDADIAAIYEVSGVEDARKAVAALKMGEATFIDARVRQASKAKIEEHELLDLLGLL